MLVGAEAANKEDGKRTAVYKSVNTGLQMGEGGKERGLQHCCEDLHLKILH